MAFLHPATFMQSLPPLEYQPSAWGLMHALWVQVNGVAYTAYAQISKLGTRLTIAGATVMLAKEQDPSKLIAPTSGKLIRYLVSNGEEVLADEAYAEIEVSFCAQPHAN